MAGIDPTGNESRRPRNTDEESAPIAGFQVTCASVPVRDTRTPWSTAGGPETGVPAHPPPLHVSAQVQASPSSHAFAPFSCRHKATGLQESSVQGLPSLHCACVVHPSVMTGL